jgi:folate-binding protein YgfZ
MSLCFAEAKLLQHLDRYLIREQVVLAGRSQEWAELLLSGPESEALLGRLGFSVPAGRLGHCLASMPLRIELRRVDLAGPTGFLVRCARAELSAAWSILVGADAVPCGQTAVEAARIEAGTPYYGQDMTEDNLPQELARNELAISFTKGCYLGQETVARIDALGRVNKTLCQVQFEPASPEAASVPEVGTELSAGGKDGKVVGHATSVTMSPKLGAPLALAYVRRESNSPGTRLESRYGPALVVGLPHEKLDPQV